MPSSLPGTRPSRGTAATRVTPERWAAARVALRDSGDRFADLVRSVEDHSVLATKDWTAAEVAAHVTGIALNYTAMVAQDGRPLPIPEVRTYLPNTTVDNIHTGLNPAQLRSFTERDPARLTELLRGAIVDILDVTSATDPTRVVPWLGGSRLPVAGVLAHMTNELLIHGRDIARATRLPWRIADDQAALFFDLFLVEITRLGYGHMLDDDRPVRQGRIAVEFRSTDTVPVLMVLEDGEAHVEEVGEIPDVRVRFRPSAMNLLLFHRIGHLRAALTGAIVVSGRKPWLLPAFLRKVRLP